MRIKEKIEKSGFFWLPTTPEKKIPGVLLITDGGDIELEVVGLFDETAKGITDALNGDAKLDRIAGHIESYGLVTLDDCFYRTCNIPFGGIQKSKVCVNRALLGFAYKENQPTLFNQLQFSLTGIDEWVGISGITTNSDHKTRSASIAFQQPENISIDLNNGMKLKITFRWTSPGHPHRKEAKITQKIFLNLTADTEIHLDNFVSSVYKIATLLCFAIDDTVCIEELSATSDSLVRSHGSGKDIPIPIQIIYKSLPFSEKEPKADEHRMLFKYSQIKDCATRIINNWISAYETIDPALNLYFSVRTGTHKYLEAKFLALAQGLETLHRRTSEEKLMDQATYQKLVDEIVSHCPSDNKDWLSGRLMYGNEISLRKRLRRISEPFSEYITSTQKISTLIQAIVDTRNYLTHYEGTNKESVAKGHDLLPLCLKMEAIFQLHLLSILGFTKEEIGSIFKNSPDIRRKLHGIQV